MENHSTLPTSKEPGLYHSLGNKPKASPWALVSFNETLNHAGLETSPGPGTRPPIQWRAFGDGNLYSFQRCRQPVGLSLRQNVVPEAAGRSEGSLD